MYKITSKTAKQQNSKTAKQQNSKTAKQQNSKTAKQQNSKTAKWISLSKFLFFCFIVFFSVNCSKKKGGGLGLGALALAGGGGSSSSSSSSTNNATKTVTPGGGGDGGDSTVTQCKIEGDKPVYLKRAYTLSYDCVLNPAVQGKTLTIDYDNAIVELSKSSFTLPKTKNASESFTVKTKQNKAFSLIPKIESKSFKKRDFSATKNIPPPTAAQIIIEEFTPTGTFPNQQLYSLIFFNNTFYLFPHLRPKYYSSSDGKTWKDEGNVHADFEDNNDYPSLTVYKNKLWLTQSKTKLLFSASIPNSGATLSFTTELGGKKVADNIDQTNMVVFQDKIVLRAKSSLQTLKTTDWNKDLDLTGNQVRIGIQPLVYGNKLWTFGGWLTSGIASAEIYSFDGKSVSKEEDLPSNLYLSGARVFANGILLIGGNTAAGVPSNDLYWSAYPDTEKFQSVKTYNKLGGFIGNGSVLKSENEIWVVKDTNRNLKVYKITFDPTQ